uniref:Uncharacterized protein n=1 Tax=Siphoviridae sp. ctq8D8 TaxID=2827944 RepID=A0A8S5SM94_9CAUD|nr:MAG TPA: hypothetical protein [Siphoviridae sp. ctq8D8]
MPLANHLLALPRIRHLIHISRLTLRSPPAPDQTHDHHLHHPSHEGAHHAHQPLRHPLHHPDSVPNRPGGVHPRRPGGPSLRLLAVQHVSTGLTRPSSRPTASAA